jgi:two-component system response regulator BaeR
MNRPADNESAALILIVEDEPQLAGLLRDYLERAGFRAAIVGDGSQAVAAVRERQPALILLDVMLPGRDGMEICREVRTFSMVPIIMVTARIEEIDRLLGLDLGADDYICKPFSPREVVARVRAVLRRAELPPESRSLPFELDEARCRALLHGEPVELSAVEFRLLRHLASDPGRIFSRGELMRLIYPDHRIVSSRTIDGHVKKLRRRLAAVRPDEEWIRSVYGVGYRLEAP